MGRVQKSARKVAPMISRPKGEKCLERAEKPMKTLATQANLEIYLFPGHVSKPNQTRGVFLESPEKLFIKIWTTHSTKLLF